VGRTFGQVDWAIQRRDLGSTCGGAASNWHGTGPPRRLFFQDRFRPAEPVVSAAIARGQLPAGTDLAEFVRILIARIYLRLLVTAEPINETTAGNAAKAALAAARACTLTSS
jgi:Tetracyclin repressor-like, C-terminal domain